MCDAGARFGGWDVHGDELAAAGSLLVLDGLRVYVEEAHPLLNMTTDSDHAGVTHGEGDRWSQWTGYRKTQPRAEPRCASSPSMIARTAAVES